jgi:hypothetical protein
MLGESLMLSFSHTSQSIKLLLPLKQKAPLSNYGESVIIKLSEVQIGNILSYPLSHGDSMSIQILTQALFIAHLYKDTPPWFLPEIRNILARKLQTPANVTLRFQLSKEAAEENMRTLQKYNNNLSALIENNAGSIVSYGSEFRPVSHLEFLLMHHVNWLPLIKMLTRGSVWPLTPIEESDRLQKNEEFIARGNHKSANKYLAILKDTLEKEVKQGWMIPVPLHFINKIPDAELAPVGIDDKQFKVLPDGSKLTKYRLTHNQSFEASVVKPSRDHSKNCMMRLISTRRFKPYAYIV